MVATSFELRENLLLLKVGKAAQGIESRLSSKLAESLRCIPQTRFLDWLPMQKEHSGSAGTLYAYLEVNGHPPRYGISLRFEYVIGPGQEPAPIPRLLEKWELYSPENRRPPGDGGANWERDIATLFESLSDEQKFGEDLARAFSSIPLKQSEDLLFPENPKAKVIAIPIREQDLEAKDGTEMTISVKTRPPDDIRSDVNLETKRCILRGGAWEDKVQGELVGDYFQLTKLLRSRRSGSTVIRVKKYNWEYPMTCAQRYDKSDAQ